jgi:F-type H+-transporting ATPase subunit b
MIIAFRMRNPLAVWLLIGVLAGCCLPGPGWAAGGHAGQSAAAEGADGLNPLSPQKIKGDLALWTAVVFLLLLAILWKFAWGPLMQALDRREKAIAEQIAQAEQANAQARQLLAQYQEKLQNSQEEARQIIQQARRDAEELTRDLLSRAKAEAEAEHQRALRQIDAAVGVAIKELADHAAALAVELAGKIVEEKLSPEKHSKLIQQTVARFAARQTEIN